MNPLTRWDPLKTRWHPIKDLEEMEHRLATFFGRSPAGPKGGKEEMTVAEWTPLVDITEDEKEYLIKAELPEVKKEDVKLSVHDDVLTITGERKYEKEETNKKFHRIERAYGSFTRNFMLPEDADETKVAADFKDGVLKVHVPKSQKAKPQSTEIRIT
ncbi:MAG: Hsp20/alpha crystallin family protein [Nitrospira sp.]|jgi:HSP20 family protein|nr:Hsp20/alpha crystallin family protein [Nitrospira sp.]MDI3465952.1 Heat shock protein Hsp20 [Nitrospira sp.]